MLTILATFAIDRSHSKYGDPAPDPSLVLGTLRAKGNAAGNYFESFHVPPPANSSLTLSTNPLVVFHAIYSHPLVFVLMMTITSFINSTGSLVHVPLKVASCYTNP